MSTARQFSSLSVVWSSTKRLLKIIANGTNLPKYRKTSWNKVISIFTKLISTFFFTIYRKNDTSQNFLKDLQHLRKRRQRKYNRHDFAETILHSPTFILRLFEILTMSAKHTTLARCRIEHGVRLWWLFCSQPLQSDKNQRYNCN